jgi:hypothetical protein
MLKVAVRQAGGLPIQHGAPQFRGKPGQGGGIIQVLLHIIVQVRRRDIRHLHQRIPVPPDPDTFLLKRKRHRRGRRCGQRADMGSQCMPAGRAVWNGAEEQADRPFGRIRRDQSVDARKLSGNGQGQAERRLVADAGRLKYRVREAEGGERHRVLIINLCRPRGRHYVSRYSLRGSVIA